MLSMYKILKIGTMFFRRQWNNWIGEINNAMNITQLTIKTNGKNSRRFDRSSVIIKRNVENKNLHRYSDKEVKICKKYV